MITAKGVYTANCPECGSPTLVHVLDSDGSISTKNCSNCEAIFRGIESGVQRNSFVAVLKEEDKESDKKSSENKGFSFKRSKKSSEKKEESKKSDKKSSENKSSIIDLKTSEKPSEKKEESKKTGKKLFKW